jgi:hypothetical protein
MGPRPLVLLVLLVVGTPALLAAAFFALSVAVLTSA